MAITTIKSAQIGNSEVKRADLNTTTSGSAVVAKIIQGTGISISSTGADSGTGDVTINATGGGSSAWTTVKKTSDETRTSNTTITADSTLLFNMSANTKYAIRMIIHYDTPAAADFKWRHSGPASPNLVRVVRSHIAPNSTLPTTGIDTAYSGADLSILGTAAVPAFIEVNAVIDNGSNAGDFVFSWAQNTSDAGNTIVRAGSHLEYMVL